MLGSIYIITNQSLPNIIKIGYTQRTGKIRAKELSVTGLPHKYVVAYECHLENAYQFEQLIHHLLKDKNEAKEWFRISIDEGIKAIREATKNKIHYEKNNITGEFNDFRPEMIEKKRLQELEKRKKEAINKFYTDSGWSKKHFIISFFIWIITNLLIYQYGGKIGSIFLTISFCYVIPQGFFLLKIIWFFQNRFEKKYKEDIRKITDKIK